MLLLIHFLLTSLATGVFAAPYHPAPIGRRNDSSDNPTIATTIHSANGTDVTSSFRTMVYFQPDTRESANSSLNDRQVAPSRRVTTCRSHTAHFVQSHCAHGRGLEVSLREFVVYCQEVPSPQYNVAMGFSPHDDLVHPLVTHEEGACQPHEICVNEIPHGDFGPSVATCVDINEFLFDPNPFQSMQHGSQSAPTSKYAEGSQHSSKDLAGGGGGGFSMSAAHLLGGKGLGNRRASVIISGTNGTTPLGVESLEVDIGTEGSGNVKQQQTCTDCFGLRTQKAAPDADFLGTKATLMATTALTGLVWVAVLSG